MLNIIFKFNIRWLRVFQGGRITGNLAEVRVKPNTLVAIKRTNGIGKVVSSAPIQIGSPCVIKIMIAEATPPIRFDKINGKIAFFIVLFLF